MLVERSDVRQVPGEGSRRWFSDAAFDLIVWYDDDATGGGDRIAGFQLCYDKQGRERALSWRRDVGYSHDVVDAGELPGRVKMSPVLRPDDDVGAGLEERFRAASPGIDPTIVAFVTEKLGSYVADTHPPTRGSS